MAENYTVNYNINVNSAKAQEALMTFQTATAKLTEASKNLTAFQKKIDQTIAKFNQLAKKTPALDFKVANANKKLQSVITKLQTIERLAKKVHAINVTTTTKTGGRGSSSTGNGRSRGSSTVAPITGGTSRSSITPSSRVRTTPRSGGSPTYRALGPTMIDTGGISAIDMLKGMGLAYGITGLGSLISNAITESVAYNNIMQTTKNILGTHDKRDNFEGRFSAMERNVRDVGKLTKYTTTEVANASRFLAMAGLDVDAINQSIRPIANIALVGDTELGETADLVTNIMTGYGIAPERMRRATDIMTMTFTSANTTLNEIAEAYKYSASLLHEGGVSFEEATAAMGVLGNAGIKGSQAGTSMRTILANIVNPRSAKRDKAWKEVGVERFDENGKMRDLSDIFQDLHDKNLDVSMYYRLFDRTAAQGAISLAANIDVWNEIIRRNFMSEDLAEQLANEKINTIQGLWDQLTSAFEDQALVVFEEQETPIRNMLNELIGWINSEETLDTMRSLGKAFMEFIKMLVDFTKRLIDLYKRFEGFIKLWVELQLKLSMVLIPLRAVRSLFQFGGLIVNGAKQLGMLTMQFGSLFNMLRSGAPIRQQMSGLWSSVLPFGNYIGNTGNLHKNVSPAVLARYKQIYGRSPMGMGRTMGVGIGGMAGGMLGSYLGSGIGDANSGWNMAATVGLGVAGTAAGAYLMGAMPAIGSFLISNPVGWGILAAGAIATVTVALVNAHREAKAAEEAFNQFANSVTMVNGVLTGENRSKTEQYLELVYNKQLSLTEVVQRRVNLLKEELGLQDPEKVKTGSTSIDNKGLMNAVNALDRTDHWYSSEQMANSAERLANQFGLNRVYKNANGIWWYDMNSHSIAVNNPDGSNDKQDALAALTALYYEGVTGSEQAKIKQEFQQRLAYILRSNGSLNDILSVKQDWYNRYGNPSNWKYDADTYPSNFAYGLDELSDNTIWSADKTGRSYTYLQGLYDTMSGIYGPYAKIWRTAEDYWKGVESGNLDEATVIQYISMMDAKLGALLKDYTWQTVEQWASSLGYVNGEWQARDGNSALTMANTTRAALDSLLGALSRLNQPAQDATSNLYMFATQLRGLANGYIWERNGGKPTSVVARDGAIESVGGMRYKYDAGTDTWQPIHKDGSPMMIARAISNAEFRSMQGAENRTGSMPGSGNSLTSTITHNNKGGRTANSADYKSHYNNGNAAPKQVIVRIDKLMNVESVDLSNPDNAAVISNLKGQLAQALIDVVHDFDETWHG